MKFEVQKKQNEIE
jgi:chromosome segregation ATPase